MSIENIFKEDENYIESYNSTPTIFTLKDIIKNSFTIDESLVFQCSDIEEYCQLHNLTYQKIHSSIEEKKRYGQRIVKFLTVKLKISDHTKSLFIEIQQEFCNFFKNDAVVFTSYEKPCIIKYNVVRN